MMIEAQLHTVNSDTSSVWRKRSSYELPSLLWRNKGRAANSITAHRNLLRFNFKASEQAVYARNGPVQTGRRHKYCYLYRRILSPAQFFVTRDTESLEFFVLVKQTTLDAPTETSGTGLHTSVPVRVRILPAPPDTGYVFMRTDLGGFEIPATVESVAHCSYATTLMRTGVMLSTVEHLLAALRGANVDNAFVEVDNLELPIMDGSSEAFTEMIEQACVVEQHAARRALLVREKVSVEQGARRISIEPCELYEIDCLIDFSHPLIGVQHFCFELTDGAFGREIAAARTFGFTEEIEALRRDNLIRGGSLDNAIVLSPDGMLNKTGLRFPDEFVRHKILDIIGDFALLGMPIMGRVKAERSGHILHAALMSKLLRNRAAWEIVDMQTGASMVGATSAPAFS